MRPSAPLLSVDPHALGRLLPGTAGAGPLFPGDERLLGERELGRRLRLREVVAAQVARVLLPDEKVLYLMPALHLPPLRDRAALPGVWRRYHQVALVLTDHRVLELLLAPAGRAAGTRMQSWPLAQVAELALSGSHLVLSPLAGRRRRWRLSAAADRSVLGALLPRLAAAVPLGRTPLARPVPLGHCPACGSVLSARAEGCRACGTAFRSPRLARALAVALPGAGLLYSGHRVLAAPVAVAELMLYAVVAMGLLTVIPDLRLAALAVAAVVVVGIKLVTGAAAARLADRSIPEPDGGRSAWRRAAVTAGVASTVAAVVLVVLTASLAAVVDRDLDFSGAPGWAGGFDRAGWRWDPADPTKRSEWTSRDGRVVVVFAFPLDHEGVSAFRASFEQQWTATGEEPITPLVVAGLEGFRCVAPFEDGAGILHHEVRYVVFEPEGRDAHVLSTVCWPAETGSVEEQLRELLALARWVPAAR